MIKDLVKDDAVLSQPCDVVTAEEAAALAADLTDTLESLENVACLHANQLGVTKAAFIYLDADDKSHIMFNARIACPARKNPRSRAMPRRKSATRSLPATSSSRRTASSPTGRPRSSST